MILYIIHIYIIIWDNSTEWGLTNYVHLPLAKLDDPPRVATPCHLWGVDKKWGRQKPSETTR